jgi:hypothetical protein
MVNYDNDNDNENDDDDEMQISSMMRCRSHHHCCIKLLRAQIFGGKII